MHPNTNADKFSKFKQGDRTAYTMVALMSDSEFLVAIKQSETMANLIRVGEFYGDHELWVFNGDIDWDYYLQTERFRVKSDTNNLRSASRAENAAELRNAHYEDYLRRHPRDR